MNHGEEENATMAIAPRTSRTACTEFRDTMALWKTRVSTRWFNQTWWHMVIYPANMVNNVDLKIKQYKPMDVTNGISGCGFVWNCWVYLRQVAFFKKDTLFFFPTLGFWRYHNFHAKHTVYLQLGWYVGELVYHLKMLVFETLQRNSCQVFPGQIMVV